MKGTSDGASFAGSLPTLGDERRFLVVKKEFRDTIGRMAGDLVVVKMDIGSSNAVVEVRGDFERALAKKTNAAE